MTEDLKLKRMNYLAEVLRKYQQTEPALSIIEGNRNLDNLLGALKSTRQQSTYLSLEEIVRAIKEAFPEEYKLIGEKLL